MTREGIPVEDAAAIGDSVRLSDSTGSEFLVKLADGKPITEYLVGHKTGEKVMVAAPGGSAIYTILGVFRWQEVAQPQTELGHPPIR